MNTQINEWAEAETNPDCNPGGATGENAADCPTYQGCRWNERGEFTWGE